jgi:hypothetical protein
MKKWFEWENSGGYSGLGPPGFIGFLNYSARSGGSALRARAGRFDPTANVRTHCGASMADAGLRIRGACVAALLLLGPVHWIEIQTTYRRSHAKLFFSATVKIA